MYLPLFPTLLTAICFVSLLTESIFISVLFFSSNQSLFSSKISQKKKKDKIRYERQFKDITSTLFAFKEDSDGIADFESENQELKT